MIIRNKYYSPEDGGGSGGAPAAPGPSGGGSWLDGISDEFRGGIEQNGYKGIDDLAKSHLELQKTMGANKIVLPGEHATADDYDKFYSQLGRPAEAAAYEFTAAEGASFTEADTAFHDAMRPFLHKAGLTQAQLDILAEGLDGYTGSLAEAGEAEKVAAVAAAEKALRSEYGAEADGKLALANQAIRQLGSDQLVRELEQSGFGRNPEMVKVFSLVGEALAGDLNLVDAGKSGVGLASTPETAAAEAKRIRDAAAANPNHPYINNSHPEHKEVRAKMMRLEQIANPG